MKGDGAEKTSGSARKKQRGHTKEKRLLSLHKASKETGPLIVLAEENLMGGLSGVRWLQLRKEKTKKGKILEGGESGLLVSKEC